MLQQESRVDVADNTGAKIAYIIRVLGGSTARRKSSRLTAEVGDRVVVSIKKALPGGDMKTGTIAKAVIVRTAYPIRRIDGSYVKFDRNAVVLNDDDGKTGQTSMMQNSYSLDSNLNFYRNHYNGWRKDVDQSMGNNRLHALSFRRGRRQVTITISGGRDGSQIVVNSVKHDLL